MELVVRGGLPKKLDKLTKLPLKSPLLSYDSYLPEVFKKEKKKGNHYQPGNPPLPYLEVQIRKSSSERQHSAAVS